MKKYVVRHLIGGCVKTTIRKGESARSILNENTLMALRANNVYNDANDTAHSVKGVKVVVYPITDKVAKRLRKKLESIAKTEDNTLFVEKCAEMGLVDCLLRL